MEENEVSLALAPALPFVGRSAELRRLRTLLPRAQGEGRRVVLLGGEAGSGKSRLAREFAAEAARDGALVLYGGCDAVVQTPYGPFAEALEALLRALDPDELADAMAGAAGELIRLLPDVAEIVGREVEPPLRADPDTERHRLHTAVVELLERVGRRRPLLLVIEDAHWADSPTLLLLRHLARAAPGARMLLFATFRDTEADLPAALAQTLADLRRSEEVTRMRLGGLSAEEVGEFVRRAAEGQLDSEALALEIGGLTGGNPFLVCELWRALMESELLETADGERRLRRPLAELATPESVREVVGLRLARLTSSTTLLLEFAATAGGEFELELLRQAGLSEGELFAALEEATRSGMIEELVGRGLVYRFTHELVRRAVYDRLTGARRAQLHLRVGMALEERGVRSPRALGDLAHHFTAAAPIGERERAVRYSLLAARAAADALAFEEAAERLTRALELGLESPRERAQALIELGTVRHRAGKALDAVAAFRAAAEQARELGDPELLGRAAMGFEDACWRPGLDEGAVDLLEEALTALPEARSALRVGLLSGLARALDVRGEHERGAVVRASAIAMARELGDREGLANVLIRSYWSRGLSPIEDVLGMLAEARELGEALRDTEIQAEATAWSVPSLVASGDLAAARRQISSLREIASASAQPFMLHVAEHFGSAIALAEGRLADAERMARLSDEAGRLLTGRDASGSYGIQMFSIRREQGRLSELAPVIRILAREERAEGPWRPGLACVLVELGMEEEARRELARIREEGLEPFRQSLWLASLTYIADASAALGDREGAALVYPALEPFGGSNVMIGHLVACYGSADRYLGMLAATLGERERAERHFRTALELNRRMGARTWLARTAYEYARMLLGRGGSDEERAGELLGDATRLGREIGMASLLARVEALGAPALGAGAKGGLPDDLSPREAQIVRLLARGLSNREIGADLFISEHTVANHIRSILRKTGCANRTEAASYAHRRGLVEA